MPNQASNLSTEHRQRKQIENVLRESQGNKPQAAQLLGIDRSTLWRRMQKFGLDT